MSSVTAGMVTLGQLEVSSDFGQHHENLIGEANVGIVGYRWALNLEKRILISDAEEVCCSLKFKRS